MVHNDTFILILNHMDISIGITQNIEGKVAFTTQYLGCQTLLTPVWNRVCNNPPREEQPWNTETALFPWMFPSPADGRGTLPGTPLELSRACVPLQVRKMSPPLLFSGFLLSCYPYEVQYPCNFCHRSRGPAAGPTG